MRPCVRCRRHVRLAESRCPFCAAALIEATAPSASVAWGLGAALLIACGPGEPPGENGSTSGGTSSGEPLGITSSSDTSGSTGAPTSGVDTSTSTGTDDACGLDDEGAGFIYGAPFDLGIDEQCEVLGQTCCAADEKCAPWSDDDSGKWNATRCVPVTGDKDPGEPCTTEAKGSGIDDCRFGAMCWPTDEDDQGVCVPLCSEDELGAAICGEGLSCVISNVLHVCLPTCDPLAQDCPAGDGCVPNGDDFACVFDASGDAGQANDPCQFQNGCDPGLFCLDPPTASSVCDLEAVGCCQPFCEFPDGACPNADQSCVQWYPADDIPPGAEDLGVCAIPA